MIIFKWLDFHSTCFYCIITSPDKCQLMDIYYGHARLLHVHWYTHIPLYLILSLVHYHHYWPTGTLNIVLHVNIRHTGYRYFMLFHVHVSPLHRYWDSRHDYCMFVNYWDMETLLHGIPLHGYSVHSYFMSYTTVI